MVGTKVGGPRHARRATGEKAEHNPITRRDTSTKLLLLLLRDAFMMMETVCVSQGCMLLWKTHIYPRRDGSIDLHALLTFRSRRIAMIRLMSTGPITHHVEHNLSGCVCPRCVRRAVASHHFSSSASKKNCRPGRLPVEGQPAHIQTASYFYALASPLHFTLHLPLVVEPIPRLVSVTSLQRPRLEEIIS